MPFDDAMGQLTSSTSRRTIVKTGAKLAYAAPIVAASMSMSAGLTGAQTVSGGGPITPACTRDFTREIATQGSGTGGTSQCCGASGCVQTVKVNLVGALANQAYDVYIDQDSQGSGASHLFAGTFTTNGSGDGSFTGTISVPAAATVVDNEVVLQGDSFTAHQFIQQSFTPCAC